MLGGLREQVTSVLSHVELRIQRGEDPLLRELQPADGEMHEGREDPALVEAGAERHYRARRGDAGLWRTDRRRRRKRRRAHGRVGRLGRCRRPGRGPEDPAQRRLPLRLGEEVQALPRQSKLANKINNL